MDARAVEQAGAWAILLELIRSDLAGQITVAASVPTVGIGSGPNCDGQALVIHDLIGAYPWFVPQFVKPRKHVAEDVREAAAAFIRDVKAGK